MYTPYKDPIYTTRRDTCLTSDWYVPYAGGRERVYSEEEKLAVQLRMVEARKKLRETYKSLSSN